MNILLANPPWRLKDRLGVRAGSRWPFTTQVEKGVSVPLYIPFPFFLAYSASVLKKNGFNVLLIDAIAEGLSETDFLKKAVGFAPEIILFETSTPSIDNDIRILRMIKDTLLAKLVLSGPHVSALKEKIIEDYPFVDFVLAGEYEYAFLELVKSLQQNLPLENILGLVYKADDGSTKVNSFRPVAENLDDLPWPERESLPMCNYRDAFCGLPSPGLQMWASRGCPHQCIFCLWPAAIYGGSGYRARSSVDVVNEMAWCIDNFGFKSVYFDDDTFNINREHVLNICREIKRRNLKIAWAAMCRADNIDKEMLEEMKSSGLSAVKYGVESGSQEIIDNCGKKLDLNIVKEAVRITKEAGIRVHLAFILGLPGETKETMQKTISFVLELNPDSAQFSLATPFPGTAYFRAAKKSGLLLTQDWPKYDGNNGAVVRTEELSKEDLEKALLAAKRLWVKSKK